MDGGSGRPAAPGDPAAGRQGTLGSRERLVEVAVDAVAAPGGRLYTYRLPAELADVGPGEAVIVDFGRRQALGIVLGEEADMPAEARDDWTAAATTGVTAGGGPLRQVRERVRGDGPLLDALQVRLARMIAERYVAPPALVVRAMLPPGALERLELVASLPPEGDPPAWLPSEGADLLRRAGSAGVPARRLGGPGGGRARLLRGLRTEAAAGRLRLTWSVRTAGSRPRLERRVRLTRKGCLVAEGSSAEGRLGPRQQAVLAELAAGGIGAASIGAAGLAAGHGGSAVASLVRRGLVELELAVVERPILPGRIATARPVLPAGADLTAAQAAAAEPIVAAIRERRSVGYLLEGATAAGKTAVYAAAIEAALTVGRTALVLVPEIALAAPLLDRLRAALPREAVGLLHSALADGERADEWRRVRQGQLRVVVGTRIAILAPLGDPGLIVVDEEHDASYKSDRTPRYQARDLALELGRLADCPVVLGSATPDVVSVARARRGELVGLRLADRLAGKRPAVELVDLRAELRAGNRGLLSARLADALGALSTAEGARAVLVLNRRGSASIVLCRDCGYVQVCPECRRPLVYHAAGTVLRCHHCGASAPIARRCPACGSARIRYLGGGTEKLEAEVVARFPALRVGRLDRDISERRGGAEAVVDAFTDGRLDVLVGTSLVTKGLDVPEVTLVGVVLADVALSVPDERSAERTWQLLRQAIGRAGRGDRAGLAIVQTYLPEHPAIQAAVTGDAGPFIEAELAARRAFGSPPFGRLVKLTVGDEDRARAEGRATTLRAAIESRAKAADAAGAPGGDTRVLGPAPAYVARRAGRWRFHLVLRGSDPLAALGGDPGAPWSVDVDPESLL